VGCTILCHRPGKGVATLAGIDETRAALAEPGAVVWVDFDARTADSDAILGQVFGFHPLAIEDVYKDGHIPKIEDYEDNLYLIVQAIVGDGGWDLADVATIELDLFIGKNFVVTHHAGPLPALELVREPFKVGKNHLERGPAFLAHAIIDAIVDRFEPVAVAFEAEIDALEVRVLKGNDEAALGRILELIRSLHHLRRVAFRQRDLIERLSKEEYSEIPEEARPFFRDVHDHFTAFTDSLEVDRDDLQSLFNAHSTLASQRVNDVMRVLTVVSTIFMPLTFIVGVYGMNFDAMPEIHTEYGYFVVLGVMAAIAGTMVYFFRRRKWM
jgi:magnesium transporter